MVRTPRIPIPHPPPLSAQASFTDTVDNSPCPYEDNEECKNYERAVDWVHQYKDSCNNAQDT